MCAADRRPCKYAGGRWVESNVAPQGQKQAEGECIFGSGLLSHTIPVSQLVLIQPLVNGAGHLDDVP